MCNRYGSIFLVPIHTTQGLQPCSIVPVDRRRNRPNRRCRLDVLGTCYRVIRNSYSNNPPDVAHRMLEKEGSRYGSSLDMSLYIDGYQAAEKGYTAAEREGVRNRALELTTKALDTLESRLDNGLRIRKRHFVDVRSGLTSSFYWSRESRLGFAQYMQNAGWTVKVDDTEADLSIAIDAEPDDIVISSEREMNRKHYALISRFQNSRRHAQRLLYADKTTSDILPLCTSV